MKGLVVSLILAALVLSGCSSVRQPTGMSPLNFYSWTQACDEATVPPGQWNDRICQDAMLKL